MSLIRWHSLSLNFVPSLLLHDGQAGGGRGTGAGIWRRWASRREGQEQGADRSDGTGRAGKLAGGAGGEGTLHTGEVKRGTAPGCDLPDEAPKNKNLN